jgi:hypothetical protein
VTEPSIKLVPYHSISFGTSKRLASANVARRFASRLTADRTVIVTRGVRDWSLPDAPNIIKYPPSHARSASLGPKTLGGRAILAAYGIDAME